MMTNQREFDGTGGYTEQSVFSQVSRSPEDRLRECMQHTTKTGKYAGKKKNRKGFTLVELLVVLVIIAVLAAMLIPVFTKYTEKAKNADLIVMAKSLYTATQAVALEAYANGEFTVEGTTTNTKTSLPDIREIIALSKLKDSGDAGLNYALKNAGTTGIINGFGYGQNTNSSNQKGDATYHFKALINEDGAVVEFVVCDGERYAVFKGGSFEIVEAACNDNHDGHKLYNYIILDKDKGAATFANMFKNRGNY